MPMEKICCAVDALSLDNVQGGKVVVACENSRGIDWVIGTGWEGGETVYGSCVSLLF